SPLGCRAGLAVFEGNKEEQLNDRAHETGQRGLERYKKRYDRNEVSGDIRVIVAMRAMELVTNRETKRPHQTMSDAVLQEAHRRGLIALRAGMYNNVIRLLMPLVITDEQLEEGLNILETSIQTVIAAEHHLQQ